MKNPTLALLGLASLLASVNLAHAHDRYTPLAGSGGAVLVMVPHQHGATHYPGSTMGQGRYVPPRHYPTAYSYPAYPYSPYSGYRQGMAQPVVVQTYQSFSSDGWTTTVTTVPAYSTCIGCTISP